MHHNAILFLYGIFAGAAVVMTWFILFKGRQINDIKDRLYKTYKQAKKIIETEHQTVAPIDKT